METAALWLRETRAFVLCALLAGACALCACDVYESELLRGSRQDGQSAEDAGPGADRDAGGEGCHPSTGNEDCPQSCPERCNGRDDDCDGEVDEAPSTERCSLAQADSVCSDGACRIVSCREGYRDCDEHADNGCEVVPWDPAHCQGCGRGCGIEHADALCVSGACQVATCQLGWGDCDEDRLSCETRVDSDQHCGVCGRACEQLPNARAGCTAGRCQVRECDKGHGDCDGNPDNGCEQRLTSLKHCGACGEVCRKASCVGGVCTAVECDPAQGLADCDADEVSCESDLKRDAAHCGSCDNACRFGVETPHARPGCADGVCSPTCEQGYGDCDHNFATGCEAPLTTDMNCGACGHACTVAHGQGRCAEGQCALIGCEPGWGNCDSDSNACERALNSVESCGSCERRCQIPHAVPRCTVNPGVAARCEIERCEDGWQDCNGNLEDGCERDSRPAAMGGQGPCLPDPSCAVASENGHNFYFCSAPKSWDDARAACRSQLNGDLARLRDAATRDFIRARLRERVWIGHTDRAKPDLWVWASNGVPFWQGRVNGMVLNGAFASWAANEPNGSGDCGALAANGGMDDLACSTAQPYVCEVSMDLCPDDPDKGDPGQCGCGRRDVDSNGDGFADCAP